MSAAVASAAAAVGSARQHAALISLDSAFGRLRKAATEAAGLASVTRAIELTHILTATADDTDAGVFTMLYASSAAAVELSAIPEQLSDGPILLWIRQPHNASHADSVASKLRNQTRFMLVRSLKPSELAAQETLSGLLQKDLAAWRDLRQSAMTLEQLLADQELVFATAQLQLDGRRLTTRDLINQELRHFESINLQSDASYRFVRGDVLPSDAPVCVVDECFPGHAQAIDFYLPSSERRRMLKTQKLKVITAREARMRVDVHLQLCLYSYEEDAPIVALKKHLTALVKRPMAHVYLVIICAANATPSAQWLQPLQSMAVEYEIHSVAAEIADAAGSKSPQREIDMRRMFLCVCLNAEVWSQYVRSDVATKAGAVKPREIDVDELSQRIAATNERIKAMRQI